jgi:hypothetical protein
MNFKPGYVPQGWIKGEELNVIEPSPGVDHDGRYGMGSITLKDSYSRAGNGDAIFALHFLGADRAEVQKWLDWWKSNDTDPQPPTPIKFEGEDDPLPPPRVIKK